MSEMAVDPLEPPKFKHKRVPRASGSPPVPVMHSPPRPVTVKDQQDWKIPPCISNWKNPKGYTIPLDKRLAADGRGLQEVQINDNFAKLSEALYVAEQKAREAVQMRSKVQRELMLKEKERKEQELRALAQKARMERTGGPPAPSAVPAGGGRGTVDVIDEDMDMEQPREPREQRRESREEREARIERDRIREERRRERERERRLEAKDAAMGKKSKITRDRDRDISEKIALGMASTGGAKGGEVMYDQRLFNQDKGMDSGFATDDQYNIYSKGLFTAQSTMSTLYRPKKDGDSDVYGDADEQLEKVMKTERFKPDKGFTGASERTGKRDRPVEFDKQEENDPFGLDQFLTEVKKGKKAVEKIGGGGTMKASGGSSMRDDYDGGSGRSRINFERGR
jgi:SNW domain-containing protein 1